MALGSDLSVTHSNSVTLGNSHINFLHLSSPSYIIERIRSSQGCCEDQSERSVSL